MVLKNKIWFLAAFCFASLIPVYPQQDKPMTSSGDIQFCLDNAAFSGREGKSYVEFYLMFYADQLKLKNSNKGELIVNTSFKDNNGNEISKDEWTIEAAIPEREPIKSKVIYDQFNKYLTPGNYQVKLTVTDANNKRMRGELNSSISIPEISSDKIHSSQLEFTSSSAEKNYSDVFKKGNQFIVPNPSRRYGILNPALSFYYELYNTGLEGMLQIKYSLFDNRKNKEVKSELNEIKKPGNSAAILKSIDISDVKSGIYELQVNISDNNRNALKISRPFEIIQGDFLANIKSLSEEEIKIYTTLLSYIATESQVNNFKKLDPAGKAEYLIQYWKSVDPTPGTPENEYLDKIQKRFVYAANNLGWSSVKGWETDMGRICIKYGIPDQIDQHNSEGATLPYQIWTYKESREYKFVFGDLHGDGKYTLLHSNKEGEISNSQWLELLKKM